MGALIVGALQGRSKEEILSARFSPVEGYWERRPLCADIDEVAAGSFKQKAPPGIKGTGYVVKSLEAALWAFFKGASFEESCLLAANLGDDADTTAAICGQLAGAFYGEGGIPVSWRSKLAKRELIEGLADRLYEMVVNTTPDSDTRLPLPFPRSYWVVPGKLLAGQYPGALDRSEEQRKLVSLLDADISVFIDLIEEDERGPTGKKVREYETTIASLAHRTGKSTAHIRRPIPDVSVTMKDNMVKIMDNIDAAITAGKRVYVHCLGGRGRTGTIVGCWLVRHGLASPNNAVAEIQRLRASTPDAAMPSPETGEQRRMIEKWKKGE